MLLTATGSSSTSTTTASDSFISTGEDNVDIGTFVFSVPSSILIMAVSPTTRSTVPLPPSATCTLSPGWNRASSPRFSWISSSKFFCLNVVGSSDAGALGSTSSSVFFGPRIAPIAVN